MAFRDQHLDRPAGQLVTRISEHFFGQVIDGDDRPVVVHDDNRVGRDVEERAQVLGLGQVSGVHRPCLRSARFLKQALYVQSPAACWEPRARGRMISLKTSAAPAMRSRCGKRSPPRSSMRNAPANVPCSTWTSRGFFARISSRSTSALYLRPLIAVIFIPGISPAAYAGPP